VVLEVLLGVSQRVRGGAKILDLTSCGQSVTRRAANRHR
jgi:hypothetical protein